MILFFYWLSNGNYKIFVRLFVLQQWITKWIFFIGILCIFFRAIKSLRSKKISIFSSNARCSLKNVEKSLVWILQFQMSMNWSHFVEIMKRKQIKCDPCDQVVVFGRPWKLTRKEKDVESEMQSGADAAYRLKCSHQIHSKAVEQC